MKKKWLIWLILSCICLLFGYLHMRKTVIRLPHSDQILISNQDGKEIQSIKGSEVEDFLSDLVQIHPYFFDNTSNQDQPVGVENYYQLTFQPHKKIAYLYEKNGKTYLEFPYERTVRTQKSLSELID